MAPRFYFIFKNSSERIFCVNPQCVPLLILSFTFQVEFETILEHPFFVYGQGWASCNPDRTLHCYGLKVHLLQVGDVLISLTPREPSLPPPRSTTIITTATTTAVTARQVSAVGSIAPSSTASSEDTTTTSAESMASRKRRWSAPDQICDEDEHPPRKH